MQRKKGLGAGAHFFLFTLGSAQPNFIIFNPQTRTTRYFV